MAGRCEMRDFFFSLPQKTPNLQTNNKKHHAMSDLLSYLASLPLLTQILMGVCLVAIVVVGAEVAALMRKARQYQVAALDLEQPQAEKQAARRQAGPSFAGLKRVLEAPLRLIFGKASFPWEEILVMYLFLALAIAVVAMIIAWEF